MSSRDFFRGKRIAMIGLGPHGEMAKDAAFMIKAGALVSVYDLRSEARLKEKLLSLRTIGLANYICGSIPAEDLQDMDLIVLSHEYPRDSSFLKQVPNIPVEYPETLFFKLAPPVTLVGVMGSHGKTTVMSMLAPLLELACQGYESQGFFEADPESDSGLLCHLKKIKNGDIVLMKITGPMAIELAEMRISPHIAIFTTMPERSSYLHSPFDILSHQTYNNFIIASDPIIDATYSHKLQAKAKMFRTKASLIPADWPIAVRGPHEREDAALALQAARLFKLNDDQARESLAAWSPLKNHIELTKKVKGIEFYNDSASTTPEATLTALQSVSVEKNALLVFGGADGGIDYARFYDALPELATKLVLVPGSGTMKERKAIREIQGIQVFSAPSIEEACRLALEHAPKGGKVLYSPGFPPGGIDSSRKERGERFVRAVRAL